MPAKKTPKQKAVDSLMRIYRETLETGNPDEALYVVARLLRLRKGELKKLLEPARKRFAYREVLVSSPPPPAHRPSNSADDDLLVESAGIILKDYQNKFRCSSTQALKAIQAGSTDVMPLLTAVKQAKAKVSATTTSTDKHLAYLKLKPRLAQFAKRAIKNRAKRATKNRAKRAIKNRAK